MIRQIAKQDLDIKKLSDLRANTKSFIDDANNYSGVTIKKPWGYEYELYQNDKIAIWILHVKKGFKTSLHCHPNKKTSLFILSGKAIFSSLHDNIIFEEGNGLSLESGVFHQTEGISEKGVLIIEIETPNNKGDLIRLQDPYGRSIKSYMSGSNKEVAECSLSLDENSPVRRKMGLYEVYLSNIKDCMEQRGNIDFMAILNGKAIDNDGKVYAKEGDIIQLNELAENIKKNDCQILAIAREGLQ